MTAFFVKTDAAVVGPFSGVELRELALAGILRFDSVISDSAHGPWQVAAMIGLFSEKKVPLPHPPGVELIRYQVRGMLGAFQGPFKLRELIGFAVRGMLPEDALLQGNRTGDWIPAKRFRVLSACLSGDLVLLDDHGRVIHRAVRTASPPIDLSKTHAPIELTRHADDRDSTAFAVDSTGEDVSPSEVNSTVVLDSIENEATESSAPWTFPGRVREWMSESLRFEGLRERLHVRQLVSFAAALVLLVAVSTAFSYWKRLPTPRASVLGEWMVLSTDSSGEKTTAGGIAFRENGQCVFFDPTGASWSGDFEWVERADDSIGFKSATPISSTIDTAKPGHIIDDIRPTDGYLRLSGLGKERPRLDGHPVRELFIRRDANGLRMGYPTSVRWTQESKTMLAAWVTATPCSKHERALDPGTTANTPAGELIAKFGIPDEARKIYRFEIPENRTQFADAHVVRYGNSKLILTPDGQLQRF